MTDSGSGQQLYSYVYDRYGNRWQQNALQGGWSSNLSFNTANNQITSGYTYDAAGNLVSDGTHTYTYDAEGNLINDGVHSYTYDAEGNLLKVDGGNTATYQYSALPSALGRVALDKDEGSCQAQTDPVRCGSTAYLALIEDQSFCHSRDMTFRRPFVRPTNHRQAIDHRP